VIKITVRNPDLVMTPPVKKEYEDVIPAGQFLSGVILAAKERNARLDIEVDCR